MSRPVLKVDGISKRYALGEINRRMLWEFQRDKLFGKNALEAGGRREHWALKEVSFGLQEGDVLTLMGGDGAGAVVTKDVPAHTVMAGNLQRIVKKIQPCP